MTGGDAKKERGSEGRFRGERQIKGERVNPTHAVFGTFSIDICNVSTMKKYNNKTTTVILGRGIWGCGCLPWSKSSPKGPEVPVLRACLPSIASRDWYTNRPIPKLQREKVFQIPAMGRNVNKRKNILGSHKTCILQGKKKVDKAQERPSWNHLSRSFVFVCCCFFRYSLQRLARTEID
jgi:hypothetical protein